MSVRKQSAACPGANTVRFEGLTPSGQFELWGGQPGGSSPLPSGPCAGTSVPLGQVVKQLPTLTAGPNGKLDVPVNLPALACGKSVVAVDLTTCNSSPALGL